MKTHRLPPGVWPVMLTPFDVDGRVDWIGYRSLIKFYLGHGVAGLFATCLSSEVQHLTADEQVALADRAVKITADRVPVVAGVVADVDPQELAERARQLASTGVDGVVFAAGSLCPADADEPAWRSAFKRLMEATPGIRLGLYECPWPNHRILSAETLGWLAETGRVFFHKDTSCNADALAAKLAAVRGTPLNLYNAHTPTLRASLDQGAAGYSGVGANFAPELYVRACADDPADPAVWDGLEALDRLIPPGYPANAKALLAARDVNIGPTCRAGATVDPSNLASLKRWLTSLTPNDTPPREVSSAHGIAMTP